MAKTFYTKTHAFFFLSLFGQHSRLPILYKAIQKLGGVIKPPFPMYKSCLGLCDSFYFSQFLFKFDMLENFYDSMICCFRVWDVRSGRSIHKLKGHKVTITFKICINPFTPDIHNYKLGKI